MEGQRLVVGEGAFLGSLMRRVSAFLSLGSGRRHRPSAAGTPRRRPAKRKRATIGGSARLLALRQRMDCAASERREDEVAETRPLRIGIAGALGRMGRAVVGALSRRRADAALVLAFDQPGPTGQTAGAATLGQRRRGIGGCDVVIDFTTAPPRRRWRRRRPRAAARRW